MIDLCLINPPAPGLRQPTAYPPLGILYIAASVRKAGFSVSVVNLSGSSNEEVVPNLPEAMIYGISCHTATYPNVRDFLVPVIRKFFPQSKIVLGGPHATIFPEKVNLECNPDCVVDGEGEEVFPSILRNWDSTKFKIIPAPRIYNLDFLPFPARDLLPRNQQIDPTGLLVSGEWATTIITSRGCPYKCAFCSKTKVTEGVRYRSPKNILNEMEQVRSEFDCSAFRFVDDAFSVDNYRVLDLCDLLEGMGYTIGVILRADTIQEMHILNRMKSAGVVEAALGVETADPSILEKMNKRETVQEMVRAVHNLRDAGIRSKVFLIQGLPGETLDSIEETKKFMKLAKPDGWTLSQFTPLPGSHIWNSPLQYGVNPDRLKVENGWFYPDSTSGAWADFKEWLNGGSWRK